LKGPVTLTFLLTHAFEARRKLFGSFGLARLHGPVEEMLLRLMEHLCLAAEIRGVSLPAKAPVLARALVLLDQYLCIEDVLLVVGEEVLDLVAVLEVRVLELVCQLFVAELEDVIDGELLDILDVADLLDSVVDRVVQVF